MGRKIPENQILTEQEQKQLLEVFNCRYPTAERNKTIVMVMLDSGLRLSELTALEWKDVNLQAGTLFVRNGKGSKQRKLWINEEPLKQLKKWRERQAKELEKRDITKRAKFVFTTLKGNQLKNRNVREMIYTYSEKAGITKQISPHSLRHTFATDFYKETKNIRMVQKALGHSDLSTTMIYTHIVDDELEQAMKNFRRG